MNLTQTLSDLEKEVAHLEVKVGHVQKFCAYLLQLENERQKAFAYTDTQQPEEMFKFNVIWQGHYINGEIPASMLNKLLSKENPELSKYRELSHKLSKIKQMLGE